MVPFVEMSAGDANAELIAGYVRAQVRRGLSRASVTDRTATLRALAASMAPRNLLETTPADIENWLDRPMAPRSRLYHLSNISAFFAWAIRADWLESNPVTRLDRPKVSRLLPRPMRADDLRFALTVADDRTRAWLMLAAYQGLRVSEISRLRREHVVDTNDPPLLLVEHGKGGHSRVLPLNVNVERALRVHGMHATGYLFLGRGREHIAAETVTKYLSRFFVSLGIDATAHQLRHFFASAVYAQTHDLRLVQELLGHQNPSTTAAYCAWSPQRAAEVVRGLTVG